VRALLNDPVLARTHDYADEPVGDGILERARAASAAAPGSIPAREIACGILIVAGMEAATHTGVAPEAFYRFQADASNRFADVLDRHEAEAADIADTPDDPRIASVRRLIDETCRVCRAARNAVADLERSGEDDPVHAYALAKARAHVLTTGAARDEALQEATDLFGPIRAKRFGDETARQARELMTDSYDPVLRRLAEIGG
jgi:hypothetical protein